MRLRYIEALEMNNVSQRESKYKTRKKEEKRYHHTKDTNIKRYSIKKSNKQKEKMQKEGTVKSRVFGGASFFSRKPQNTTAAKHNSRDPKINLLRCRMAPQQVEIRLPRCRDTHVIIRSPKRIKRKNKMKN